MTALPIFRDALRGQVEIALEAALNAEEPSADAVPKAAAALMVMVDLYVDNVLAHDQRRVA